MFALPVLAASLLAACATEGQQLRALGTALIAVSSPPKGTRALGTGTGFFIAQEGFLLTAHHVVEACLRIDVVSETIEPTPAMVVVSDNAWDLAVLRVATPLSAPTPTLALSVTPAATSKLTAYGYPQSSSDVRRAVHAGVTMANGTLNRTIAKQLVKPGYMLWLDGPMERGYSGGPVLDTEGQVVGIVVAKGFKDPALDNHFEAIGTWPIVELLNKTTIVPRYVRTAEEVARPDELARASIVRVICWRAKTHDRDE